MAVDQIRNDYEAIRRRQYTLISDLIEVLPRINNLHEDSASQARDALFHADHPFMMVFVGAFSSGKSSLINALIGSDELLAVGPVPTTDRINILRWGDTPLRLESGGDVDTVFHPSNMLKKVSFVDTPGLESVFQRHEKVTRNFLHRSDVVLLVMLATQAMTSRNVESLQKLREYGKKVIIIINQKDLISPEEAETVKNYVQDQSLDRLGYKPQIWLVSSKQGLAAYKDGGRDEALWRESGMYQIEEYVDKQLSDLEVVRQKLQTPLQIAQNVTTGALRTVRSNQSVLDQYQSIQENLNQQLAAHKREQDKNVREITNEISDKFGQITMRGSEAIRDIFQISQAMTSVGRGFAELTGLARLLRRGQAPSYVRLAFERRKVFEPVDQLSQVSDRLGPRLEGRDLQDIDDLVKYGQKEINALPSTMREKVIGNIQAPLQYDRRALQEIRPELEVIETEARVVETDTITQTVRNALMYLALWELILLIVLFVTLISGILSDRPEALMIMLFILIGLAMGGLLILPLAGRILENQYTTRLLKLQTRYLENLAKAADRQVEYGMKLRRDVVAPLTRLIEAQTQIHTEQLNRLQLADQEMTKIEAELNRLGRRSFLPIGS
ncbi:MAG: dynamin family protein [Anaerolineae bacterium]|nr:dynamin family protein [Anaerolineae bacterium]